MPKKIAMQLTGHKARSVFDPYDIVNEQDLGEAPKKSRLRQGQKGTTGQITSRAQVGAYW